MATTPDYIEFVMEQMEAARTGLDLWYRPMFGEYCVYASEKPLVFVCDNTVFVKRIECVSDILATAEMRPPFPGAKDFVVLDMEETSLVGEVLLQLYAHKPMPKPKKHRAIKTAKK